jgi:hypothetical protein
MNRACLSAVVISGLIFSALSDSTSHFEGYDQSIAMGAYLKKNDKNVWVGCILNVNENNATRDSSIKQFLIIVGMLKKNGFSTSSYWEPTQSIVASIVICTAGSYIRILNQPSAEPEWSGYFTEKELEKKLFFFLGKIINH